MLYSRRPANDGLPRQSQLVHGWQAERLPLLVDRPDVELHQGGVGIDVDAAGHQRVLERAATAEGDVPIGPATGGREDEVACHVVVDALGQEGHRPQDVGVPGLVVEADRELDLAGTDAEPVAQPVVPVSPVELDGVVALGAEVPGDQLHPDPELVGDLDVGAESRIAEVEAAVAALHHQQVIARGVEVALRHEAVDLGARRVLGQGGAANEQRDQGDGRASPAHVPSFSSPWGSA